MEPAITPPPSDCGRRLIPGLIDDIAHFNPERPFVSIPRSSDIEDGFEDVSYSKFAAAVNACAWWLERQLARGEAGTLLYLGPLDIRYLLVILAAAKTGNVAFLSSHRNSLEAHLRLLERTHCNVIILPTGAPAVTGRIIEKRPMRVLQMPELEEILDGGMDVDVYPWQGTFDECVDKPLVVLHTSGSTSVPKPVFVTHGTFASNDAHQLIPLLGGSPTFGDHIHGKRMFLGLPLFHAANLTFTLGFGVFRGVTCVLPPPQPITVDVVNSIHTYGNVNGSLLPPSLIVEIHSNSVYLENMTRRLQFVSYVGGILHKEIGDLIAPKVKLITLMGSTETMLFPIEIDNGFKDWEYMPLSAFLGHNFRTHSDGLSELVIVRNGKLRLFQGVFSVFPGLDEYPTRDLYQRHPTIRNAWAFRARADDLIVFNNAEKLNPIDMEATISAHPAVLSAVIGGHGQFQASLLIEPKEPVISETQRQHLLSEIWPTVVQVNRACPAHGRIMKEYVIFALPDKPLPRAGKDTVQRSAALQLYAQEISSLYAGKRKLISQDDVSSSLSKTSYGTLDAAAAALRLHAYRQASSVATESDAVIPSHCTDSQTTAGHIPGPSLDLKASLYGAISRITYLYDLSDTADLFESGLDSLQIPPLVDEVNGTLRNITSGIAPITAQDIYNNPSVEKLLVAIQDPARIAAEARYTRTK